MNINYYWFSSMVVGLVLVYSMVFWFSFWVSVTKPDSLEGRGKRNGEMD